MAALRFPPVRTLIGFPYIPASVSLTSGASYSETHYPLAHLADGYGRTMWRSEYNTAAIRVDLGYPRPVNFVGLVGHNLSHNLLVSVFASVTDTSLTPPMFPPDDEIEWEWAELQLLARAVGVHYPNLWCDPRDAAGKPVTAQFWQIHITENGAPPAIGEIVIGHADEYEGIIRSPYREQMYSWQSRTRLMYGPQVVSGSHVVSRTVELDLGITPEDRVILDSVYANAAEGRPDGTRVVVVPDSRRNDLWYVEWPARREVTFPGASYRVGEQTVTLVEETFGATPSSPPSPIVPPTTQPVEPGIPAGSIMVGGYGDSVTCAYLSANGATTYPQPAAAPVPGTGLSAFARLSTGDIAQVGGNAPNFPTTGSGVFKGSDLTKLSACVSSRVGAFCVAADALGYWYSVKLSGSTLLFTKFNAASAVVTTWDIAVPNGNPSWAVSQPKAMAVNDAGTIAYVRLHVSGTTWGGSGPIQVRAFSLAGAGSLIGTGALPITDDYGNIGYGSLLCVPGSGDLLIGLSNIGPPIYGGDLKRYTPSGTLVWTAGTPTGIPPFHWQGLALGVPGATEFLAWAYGGDDTSSGARYCWFSYATGAPDNTRSFAPDDGAGFQFDSQLVVLAGRVL